MVQVSRESLGQQQGHPRDSAGRTATWPATVSKVIPAARSVSSSPEGPRPALTHHARLAHNVLEVTTMLARLRKAQKENEGGFTLIELLVVMIIIGILAAIAIPVFLNQRKKANDAAGKADVSTLGKEIATYFVDNTTNPTVTTASGRYLVNGVDTGKVSANVSGPVFNGSTAGNTATSWCVQVSVANGSVPAAKYSAAAGLATGTCVAADFA